MCPSCCIFGLAMSVNIVFENQYKEFFSSLKLFLVTEYRFVSTFEIKSQEILQMSRL